ncbi:DUF4352 domain-containing protein [Nocardia xishanensis]|uniref:DUF4352 domain-containing protein n=1 Tax=Nocardia xishanensis TaxID=238964 RepID=UPI001FE1494E|nr:DUF4352 domain-containing protein [Nocardia xishanensis]
MLWIILGVVLAPILLCGGCFGIVAMSSSNSDDPTTPRHSTSAAPLAAPAPGAQSPAPATPAPPSSKYAPAGTAVRDGKFEFQVTAIDAPVTKIGAGSFWEATARGQFIVVHVNITNVGNEPRGFFGDNQKLIDDQGREFEANWEAGQALNDDIDGTLNPGFTVSAAIAFDIPPGTVPAAAEFHDSMFSGGVKVALR